MSICVKFDSDPLSGLQAIQLTRFPWSSPRDLDLRLRDLENAFFFGSLAARLQSLMKIAAAPVGHNKQTNRQRDGQTQLTNMLADIYFHFMKYWLVINKAKKTTADDSIARLLISVVDLL